MYTTDVARSLLQVVIKLGGGKHEVPRYWELLKPKEQEETKSYTSEDVIEMFKRG